MAEEIRKNSLLRVRLSIPRVSSTFKLPIPGGGKVWDGCEFSINPPEDEACDFWIVIGFAHPREEAKVASQNTLFIAGEPPAKKIFPQAFYEQFGHVIDTHSGYQHPRLEVGEPCLGWGIEAGYDELQALRSGQKENRVGVLCSATAKTAGQRERLAFLEWLKPRLGDALVHFGREFQPVENRLEAILPYRYQLVLENSCSPHYWTEKLASSYIGWAHPIYHGCPNLGEYFPTPSFTPIDLMDYEGALTKIRLLLETSPSEESVAALAAARELVFTDYALIHRCARLARRFYKKAAKKPIIIYNYKSFRWSGKLFRHIKNMV